MGEPVLAVRGLQVGYRTYGHYLRVLDHLELEVHAGEKVGLVGESGCGKTTWMKAVLRILPPNGRVDGGRILFRGRDLLALSPQEMHRLRGRHLTAIFQNPGAALNPVFTVGQQLFDVLRVHYPHAGRRELRERAVEALRTVALPDPERLLNNYPVQLSGGMKQRVCIALALVSRADLIIADEPVTALDVTIQDQIIRLLMRMVQERRLATVFITHNLGVVREWMDRVVVMYAGTAVEIAPTRRLFQSPLHPYTQGLLKAVPRLTGGGIPEGIPGRVPDYRDPPQGCRFHPRCPHRMPECTRERPPFFLAGDSHRVACFLYRDHPVAVPAEPAAAREGDGPAAAAGRGAAPAPGAAEAAREGGTAP